MKNLLIIAFQIFTFNFTSAQEALFDWSKGIGGTSANNANSIVTDINGNVYTLGTFQGTTDFDPSSNSFTLTSNGSDDVYISKLDASGNFVWAKQFGGTSQDNGASIAITGSGELLVTGYFIGTTDFDPGIGTYSLTSNGSADMFTVKMDSNGNLIWAKQIGDGGFEYGASVTSDVSGNVYILGRFMGTVDFNPNAGVFNIGSSGAADMFILKLDANGSFIFVSTVGSPDFSGNPSPTSVFVDISGNIYCSGNFTGQIDFDPGVGVQNLSNVGGGTTDIFILKLSSTGSFMFAKSFGNTGTDISSEVKVDAIGNIYMTGSFELTVDFDPGVGIYNLTSANYGDMYILKLDNAGNFIWVKAIGDASNGAEQGNSITLDPAGNIYTTGFFSGTTDFDPSIIVNNITSNSTSIDMFILKLDINGDYVWAKTSGSTGSDKGKDIAIDNSGNVLTTGNFSGAIDLDMGFSVYYINNIGSTDAFVHKMSPCSQPTNPTNTTLTNNQNICFGNTANLSASGSNLLSWYSSAVGGNYLGAGNNYNTLPLTNTTTYYVQDSSNCGLSIYRTPVTVTVNPLPTISVNSGSICSGKSFTLNPTGANTYSYSSGSNIVSPLSNASYSITGTDINGCITPLVAISNVTVNPLPTLIVATSNTLICTGETSTLTVSGAATYTWSSSLGSSTGANMSVNPNTTTIYTVSGEDANGCINNSTITQSVSLCTGIYSLSKNELVRIYPNPSKDFIHIDFENLNNNTTEVQVLNSLDQVLITETVIESNTMININSISSGIYFVKVIQQGNQQVLKLIKE